jgi:type VII secretion effector (TIGR04197 family)
MLKSAVASNYARLIANLVEVGASTGGEQSTEGVGSERGAAMSGEFASNETQAAQAAADWKSAASGFDGAGVCCDGTVSDCPAGIKRAECAAWISDYHAMAFRILTQDSSLITNAADEFRSMDEDLAAGFDLAAMESIGRGW